MTVAFTSRTSVLLLYMKSLFVSAKEQLNIQQVLIGKHNQVTAARAVVMDAAPKHRELIKVQYPGGSTTNWISVYVDVMIADAKSGEEQASLDLYDFAEDVEDFLHRDTKMNGLLIHGFVTDWDPGVTYLQGGQWRTVRLTYLGRSETQL